MSVSSTRRWHNSSKRRQNNRKHPRFCRRAHRTSYNPITRSVTWNSIPNMDPWGNALLRWSVHERKRKRQHQQITSRHPHYHRSSSHAWIGVCLINIKNSVRKIPYAISLFPHHNDCPGRYQCTTNQGLHRKCIMQEEKG